MWIVFFRIIVISMKRGVLRYVSMLFLIFEKKMGKKIVLETLRFVSMLFLIFEKAMSKKIVLGILRLGGWRGVGGGGGWWIIEIFWVCMHAFYEYFYF